MPCVVVIAVSARALHALARLRRKAALEMFAHVFVLAAAAAGAFHDHLDGLVRAAVAASVVCAGAALIVVRRTAGAARPERASVGPLLAVGRVHLLFFLIECARPLVLLRLAEVLGLGQTQVGHLYTAISLTLPLIAIPEVFAQTAFPSMARRPGSLDARHRRIVLETLVAGVVLLVLYGAFLGWFLPWLRDGRYAEAVPVALMLLPGVLAHGATALTGYVLLVRDRLLEAALISGIALVAMALVAAWALPAHGAVGGAGALSAALIVRCALMIVAARRRRRSGELGTAPQKVFP